MSFTRAVRLVTHYARYRPHRLRPFEVQAALLNACNLRCSYCRCPEIETDQLATAQWIQILGGLGRLGTLRVKFQGGEPTIRRDFGELCAAARRAGLTTAVVTNGIAIARNPRLLDALDEVVISLDAITPQLHDAQRGAGTHLQAMTALERAREMGRRVVVNMVVHRDTAGEVEAMLQFCEQRGCLLNAQAVMFDRTYQVAEAKSIALSNDEQREFYLLLARWREQGRPLVFSPAAFRRTAGWGDFSTTVRAGRFPSSCPMGTEYVHIEPNGDVHPCGLHGGRFVPLNAVRDGLEAALLNARHHECEDCALAYLNERKLLFRLHPQTVWHTIRRS